MTKSSIIIKYAFIWLLISACYFFVSEQLIKWLAPGFDNVVIWMKVLLAGWIIVFLFMLVLLVIKLIRYKKIDKPSRFTE
jgi:hypothetical protein